MRHERRHEGGDIDGRGEADKPVRSERAQRLASIANGSRSKGPRPENRERSKLNGLVHGLRGEQLILPGEDPAEFEALRGGPPRRVGPGHTHPAAPARRPPRRRRLAAPQSHLGADVAYRRVTAEGAALASDAERRAAASTAPLGGSSTSRRPRWPTSRVARHLETRPPDDGLGRVGGGPGAGPVGVGPAVLPRPADDPARPPGRRRPGGRRPEPAAPRRSSWAANPPGGAAAGRRGRGGGGGGGDRGGGRGRELLATAAGPARSGVPDPEDRARRQMIDAAMVDDFGRGAAAAPVRDGDRDGRCGRRSSS